MIGDWKPSSYKPRPTRRIGIAPIIAPTKEQAMSVHGSVDSGMNDA